MASNYSKGSYAESLGISRGELETRAKDAGFSTTEEYYRSQGGGGGLNIDSIPSTLEFATGQEAVIGGELAELTTEMASQEKPLDVYTRLEEEAGVPEQRKVAQTLREQIYGIEDTIRRVEPTIKATTRESMVTEGQRERMAVTQKKPLLERLGELSISLGRVGEGISASMQDISAKVGLFIKGQEMDLQPLLLQYQNTVDSASRLMSAFSIDSQNQLQVLIANWQRQNELDDREYEQAFALLQQENSYTQALRSSAATAGVVLKGNESTNDILKKIGESAREEIEHARREATTDYDSFDISGAYDSWFF